VLFGAAGHVVWGMHRSPDRCGIDSVSAVGYRALNLKGGPTLDGDRVFADDTVWDLFLGAGQVEEVTPDGGFSVRFGKRHMRYTRDGYFSGVKRVYWFNPVVVVPRKGQYRRLELVKSLVDVLDCYREALT
jgi:hypothetical protein